MEFSKIFKYMKTLKRKIEINLKYYDKYSTNPFLNGGAQNWNYNAPIHEKTYIWIEKKMTG